MGRSSHLGSQYHLAEQLRYKGLAKNDNQLAMLFTLANVVRV